MRGYEPRRLSSRPLGTLPFRQKGLVAVSYAKLTIRTILLAMTVISLSSCGQKVEDDSTPVTQTEIPTHITHTQTSIPPTSTSIPHTMTPVAVTPSSSSILYQNPKIYHVDYVVTVFNQSFDIDELRVYQPNIVEWEAQRDVHIEEISPPPTDVGVDQTYGNGFLHWRVMDQPQPGESISFTLRFNLTAFEISATINPAEVQLYDESDPLYALYTQSERFIESSDPQIMSIANRVAGEEKNPYLIARKFYDYVIDTYSYQLLGKGLIGAKQLVTTSKGECGDYSALFVALSRARGIPARPVVGYWAISGIEQTHVWAEFYIEPFGWIPVDPTIGQSDHDNRDYYFGNMDNQRVILNKGYNLALDPPGPGDFVAPFLQVPLWWFWGSGGNADSMRIERTTWVVASSP